MNIKLIKNNIFNYTYVKNQENDVIEKQPLQYNL